MLGSLILYPKGRRIMMFQLSVYDYKSKTLNIKPSHPQSYTVQGDARHPNRPSGRCKGRGAWSSGTCQLNLALGVEICGSGFGFRVCLGCGALGL